MPAFLLSPALLAEANAAPPAGAVPPTSSVDAAKAARDQQEAAVAARDAAKANAAPLCLQGAKRSPATLASSPEHWGLAASDFSRLHDEGVATKAGLPARWKDVKAAATAGDAFAQHLAGLYLRLPMGGKNEKKAQAWFAAAAQQGLVRAKADVVAYQWDEAGDLDEDDPAASDADHALSELKRSDNAHARYAVGARDLLYGNMVGGLQELAYCMRAGYAPAMLAAADAMLKMAKGNPSAEQRKGIGDLARRAAAQGYTPAIEYLKKHPEL
jgi:hypothetical protein